MSTELGLRLSAHARLRLLQMHEEAGVGHIGGNLSAIDILIALQHFVMAEKDSLILSKGHAAGALYIALWSKGLITDEELKTFHKDSTKLAGHPPPNWLPQIPFATGSLGHGASLAAGAALGRRLQGLSGKVYCLLSDGELNEGSTWEALHFAAHQRLTNLVYLVDNNGIQGFGATKEVLCIGDLGQRLAGLNFQIESVDGHSHLAIQQACLAAADFPKFIIAQTIKGKGVSFMEGQMQWHYLPLTSEQYQQACREIRLAYEKTAATLQRPENHPYPHGVES
jgi:transketolase